MTISGDITLPEPAIDILRYLESKHRISCNIYPTTDNLTTCIRFRYLKQRKFGDRFLTEQIPISGGYLGPYMFENDDPDFTKHLIKALSGQTLTSILVKDHETRFEFPVFSSLAELKMKLQLRERT